jgi:PAS domain S-box-containing protein
VRPHLFRRARDGRSPGRFGLRFTELAIVLVAFGVAGVGASALVQLQRGADEARRAELLVARIGESATNLHDQTIQAVDAGLDRRVRVRVQHHRARLDRTLAALRKLNGGDERVRALDRGHGRFVAEVDRTLALVSTRGASAARRHQLGAVVPAFTRLQLEVGTATEHYDGKATDAVRTTVFGSAFAVVAAALLVGLLAIALGRRRAAREEAALEARIGVVRLLQAVSAASNAAATMDEALLAALREICTHTGWSLGHAFFLADDGSGELVSSGLWHLDEDTGDRFRPLLEDSAKRRFAPGDGLPGRVLAHRRPLWITAAAAAAGGLPRLRLAQQIGIRSAFAFPVLVKNEVVAVLEFFAAEERKPDETLLEATAHVGFQIGFLIERKRAEAELRATEAKFRTLVEQLPLATYIDGPEGLESSTYLSPQIEAMSGHAPEEWLEDKQLFQKLLHPDDRERVIEAIRQATAKYEPVEQEYRIVARDGSVRWWRDAAVVVRDARGLPSHRQGYAIDVTARKEAELRFRAAEERYRALVENLPLVTYIDRADETHHSVYISPQIETTLGYARDAWKDDGFFPSILHPEDREWVIEEHRRAYGSQVGMTLEYRLLHQDGHAVWFRDQMTIVRDPSDGGVYAQGYMLDITERKESEERLGEAEKRYRTLVEQLPLATYIDALDETSSAIYMSPQIEAMLGYTTEEWTTDKELFPKLLHPEDRERVMAEVAREHATDEPFRSEYRLIARDGQVVWIRDEAVTIRDDDGRKLYAQGYMLDITARKVTEEALERALEGERAANDHLRELDRLKDEFIALVSHELRTPLTSIRGYLEFLLEDAAGLAPEQARFLAVVERNAERLQHLVNDLLFVAQVDAGRLSIERSEVDLPALAADAVEAARVVASAAEVELELVAEPMGPLAGDRARLAQLLDNFISNAIKFTPEGGRVVVRTWVEGDRALVTVSDSGIGIPLDEQARLFERFYRASSATERAIPGTGLGLAIAKAIVDAHGGSISVESTAGVGTTFTVELPLAAEDVAARQAA